MPCPTRSTRVAGSCADELVRNSACALVLDGRCHRDAGLLEEGEGTISINGNGGRRAEVGVSKDGHIRRWSTKVESHGTIKPGSPVLLKANRLAAAPLIDVFVSLLS